MCDPQAAVPPSSIRWTEVRIFDETEQTLRVKVPHATERPYGVPPADPTRSKLMWPMTSALHPACGSVNLSIAAISY
jgi:hypothetical protein